MSEYTSPGSSGAILSFLAGGGETGTLVRAFDWSKTPVGAVDRWPFSLKTTVGTLLHSRHPMMLWWGPELIQFYNDGMLPSLGPDRHPAAMGQRGADCWHEIWPIIWPQIDDVMSRGYASWNEDNLVPTLRNGRIQETYCTYGYSPVFDDSGKIGGTLAVCTETTNRVIADRRLRSMRALSAATALAADAAAVTDGASEALSGATSDVPFALLYDVPSASTTPRLIRAIGIAPDQAAAIHGEYGDKLPAMAVESIPRELSTAVKAGPWPERVSQVFVAPIGGSARAPNGYLLVGISPRLPFDDAYRTYVCDYADHIARDQARIDAFRIRAAVQDERNALLEKAPVASALVTGADHRFGLANAPFLRIVGRTHLVGRTFLEAFPELAGTPLAGILDRVYQTGEPFVMNEMLIPIERTPNGVAEKSFFRFNLEPLRDPAGHVYGIMAIGVDVTREVLTRKRLERAQAEREALLRDLEAANRAKDEFLAMLGHELRNPLSPILTALQLMHLRGVRGADRERAIIERQVKHVVKLVDDLLDVSRITRGTIELKRERLQLATLVAKAIEQTSPLLERRRHRLRVDVPDDLYVGGDAVRLAQVVSNILTNAAKYTEPGGHITVRAARLDGELWLRVRDTGIGIGAEMLPHVFESFAQERQRSDRTQGGLGLGLAIVKSLVLAHGGTVSIESEGRGLGTECIVRLPIATADSTADTPDQEPLPSVASAAGHRVLLVDDNQDAAAMLSDALGALGYRVEVAFDAASALDVATRFVPEVALLDLGLPVIDGYELAARLRRQAGWGAVRFAALTGYAQQHDRERTMAAGFEAHLVKPVDLREVDATLKRLGSPSGSR